MTNSELNNCILIVEFLRRREDAAKLNFISKELGISKSKAVFLLEKYILPNKLLNNLDAKNPGSFVLIPTNRTEYLLETKVLEKVYKKAKTKRYDKWFESQNLRISFVKNIVWILSFVVSILANVFFIWKIFI